MVVLNVGGAGPFDGIYTIEYRQGDGWDRGFVTSGRALPIVRSSGGTVLVHVYRPAGAPASQLINGAFAAALQPCNTLVVPGFGGTVYHVTVESFDVPDGAAQVSIGSGRGNVQAVLHGRAGNEPHRADSQPCATRRSRESRCACNGANDREVESSPGHTLSGPVTEGNCVAC